jgi:uncharacterized membrane protein
MMLAMLTKISMIITLHLLMLVGTEGSSYQMRQSYQESEVYRLVLILTHRNPAHLLSAKPPIYQ